MSWQMWALACVVGTLSGAVTAVVVHGRATKKDVSRLQEEVNILKTKVAARG